ncbi:hypothetical protein [Nocardia sp. NPDC058705]|uniref:hypothetical protein n=1 Tax=Nocardia sp. NPDC058705 TaxID=3346609 RepID=UPI00368C00B3
MTNSRPKSVRCTGRAGRAGAAIYRGKQQMNRISLAVLAAGALTLTLVGCGSDESADASGLRKGTPGSSTSAPSSSAPAKPTTSSAAPAAVTADITCAQFKTLDADGEKKAIDLILAENPGGAFEGSPNVALSTAKLVCLVPSNADKPVADAGGMKP